MCRRRIGFLVFSLGSLGFPEGHEGPAEVEKGGWGS